MKEGVGVGLMGWKMRVKLEGDVVPGLCLPLTGTLEAFIAIWIHLPTEAPNPFMNPFRERGQASDKMRASISPTRVPCVCI